MSLFKFLFPGSKPKPLRPLAAKAFTRWVFILFAINASLTSTSYYLYWKSTTTGDLNTIFKSIFVALFVQTACAAVFGRLCRRRLYDIDKTIISGWRPLLVIGALFSPLVSFFYLGALLLTGSDEETKFQKFLFHPVTSGFFGATSLFAVPLLVCLFMLAYAIPMTMPPQLLRSAMIIAPKILSSPSGQYFGDLLGGVTELISIRRARTISNATNIGALPKELEVFAQKNHMGFCQLVLMQLVLIESNPNAKSLIKSTLPTENHIQIMQNFMSANELYDKQQNIFEVFNPLSVSVFMGSTDLGLIVMLEELLKIKYYSWSLKTFQQTLTTWSQSTATLSEPQRSTMAAQIKELQNRLDASLAAKYDRSYEDTQKNQVFISSMLKNLMEGAPQRATASTAASQK